MNSNYLPKNKRLVFGIGGVATAVIIGVIIFQLNLDFDDQNQDEESPNVVASSNSDQDGQNAESLETDTDGDGLKDWEEPLWETEIDNPDTDGDGTNDGQEVRENRDPTKKGPDDRLSGTNASSTANINGSTSQNPELTQEQSAARSFFARFLQLRKSGNLNQTTAQELGERYQTEMLGDQQNIDFNFETYTESDILISANSSKNALRAYGNKMGSIISSYPPINGNETELQLYVEALQSGNDKVFDEIDPYIEKYENIIQDSLQATVPERAVQTHLGYVNALNAAKKNAEAMRRGKENIIQSINYIDQYSRQQEKKVVSSLLSVSEFFRNNGIRFENDQPGALYANMSAQENI